MEQLTASDRLTIVSFDDAVAVVVVPSRPAGDSEPFFAAINTLNCGGGSSGAEPGPPPIPRARTTHPPGAARCLPGL
ncbi:hypothetical protein VB716_03020 [Synechococcus sp. CCY9201]|uniref:hypothetical protein n=1 Tax=unclassified Synechococcus TaxID=2626047 RepID=UPI002AD3F887|nr:MULTISPECIES: hypothetical protein [unclassified Synechococcus]MEA5473188.1 hypothetical protein [Synechococcus sp. CCY9201]